MSREQEVAAILCGLRMLQVDLECNHGKRAQAMGHFEDAGLPTGDQVDTLAVAVNFGEWPRTTELLVDEEEVSLVGPVYPGGKIIAARQIRYWRRTDLREYVAEPADSGLLAHLNGRADAIREPGLMGWYPYDTTLFLPAGVAYHVQTQEDPSQE